VIDVRPFFPPQIGSVIVNNHPVSTQERHLSRHRASCDVALALRFAFRIK
jgi:hypothetical protein